MIRAKPDIFRTKGRYLGLVRLQRFLEDHHHHSGIKEIAVAFQEPFGSRDRDPIYAALLQAAKAAEFRISLQSNQANQSVALSFPVVVFSGDLFRACVSDDDVTVEPVDHLVCQFAYRSRHYDRTYLIDVVTQDRLPVLAAAIRAVVDELATLIANAQHSTKTVQSFGLSPRKGVNRRGRIRRAVDDGVEVVIG